MKSIFKILVLGVVPILALTAVVDQGLAADKGSQLIFQGNMAHRNFISIANAHDSQAVTVLTQYYNDEMSLVLWYLRVLPADSNVLIDPLNHMIPGTATDDDMDGTNVSEVLGALPAMTNDDDGAGINSGHFVIAITAVGANVGVEANATDADDKDKIDVAADRNQAETANILFPTFLAADMHGTDNIDNCGVLQTTDPTDPAAAANLGYTALGADGVNDCRKADPDAEPPIMADDTSKNVGDLNVGNAQPVSFNHLTGHFTEALVSTDTGGADQTASWGGTPIIRPAVANTANMGLARDIDAEAADAPTNSDYQVLTGADENTANTPTDTAEGLDGGRLAEKDAGGSESVDSFNVTGYTTDGDNKITNTDTCDRTATPPTGCRDNRGLDMGALVLPALHGGGAESKQIMLLLSAADEFGGAGGYKLIAAKTGYTISLMDGMGDALPDPAADAGPVFGGTDAPKAPAGINIIVEGIRVMTDADLAKCTGTMIMGPWMLSSLTDIVPAASAGDGKKFAGLDAMLDPMMSASPGWIKFKRSSLTCKMDYGDGDAATGSTVEDADGVPTSDERTYTAGTLIVEEAMEDRAYVTTGQALLKFITSSSTFAASWSLKSPASPAN
ncbi:MAG: hypothetical protein OXT71_13335 [Acidobacteriota bacterium]|nr:hypothetical protein [Acidobacteriota bacterium]